MLIAFEGPDGSGKTTQRKLFKMWLEGSGQRVATTKWNSSKLIKPLVKARKAIHALNPTEFSLLHACDYRHRLETEVLPALAAGRTVVADRYLFTALARDSARGLDLNWLLNLYHPILWPDVVFYFAVSPRISLQRIAADRVPSYYESGRRGRPQCELRALHRPCDRRVLRAGDRLQLRHRGRRKVHPRAAHGDPADVPGGGPAVVAPVQPRRGGGLAGGPPGGFSWVSARPGRAGWWRSNESTSRRTRRRERSCFGGCRRSCTGV
jgi:dTMP kinase